MKNVIFFALVGCIVAGLVGFARADLITNGDFSANASAFTTYAGQTGTGNNPAISNWAATGGYSEGINFTWQYTPAPPIVSPFGPADPSAAGPQYAFIQNFNQFGGGVSTTGLNGQLAQSLGNPNDPVVAGQTYQVSFLVAGRNYGTAPTAAVQIVDTTNSTTVYQWTGTPSQSAFQLETFTFTAAAGQTYEIDLQNTTTGSGIDATVDFAKVSVAAVPEPSGLVALCGLGSIGMVGFTFWRRRKQVA